MTEVSTPPDPTVGSELPTAALRFARRVHLGQHRKQTHEQFVEHPIAVADLLMEAGYDGPMISAAYLHDVVEHTDVQLDELRERFGPDVAGIVDCLSEDPDIDGYGARKRALRKRILESGGDPVVIYAADRVANMRDWRKVPPRTGRQSASASAPPCRSVCSSGARTSRSSTTPTRRHPSWTRCSQSSRRCAQRRVPDENLNLGPDWGPSSAFSGAKPPPESISSPPEGAPLSRLPLPRPTSPDPS